MTGPVFPHANGKSSAYALYRMGTRRRFFGQLFGGLAVALGVKAGKRYFYRWDQTVQGDTVTIPCKWTEA